jgi:hypothetical protein
MESTARIWFTARQKAELWERWKSGQCVADIARSLGRRNKSGVYRILALDGGIAPNPRRRAVAALRLESSPVIQDAANVSPAHPKRTANAPNCTKFSCFIHARHQQNQALMRIFATKPGGGGWGERIILGVVHLSPTIPCGLAQSDEAAGYVFPRPRVSIVP